MSVIEVNNLCKNYGKVKAVDHLSFRVEKGDIYGLIGADGAGKSTIFKILTTLLLPQSGTAAVLGCDVVKEYKQVRSRIGYMPGKFSLYQDLSIEENLRFYATIFGTTIAENYHLIKSIYTHIEPFKKRKAGNLSGGMKQKLALCCALIHKPEILFLDEPTTGIDPISRKELWEMLCNLRDEGITIVISTPYMDEALHCNKIAFMQEGKFLKEESPNAVIKDFRGEIYAVECLDHKRALTDLQQLYGKEAVYSAGDRLHVTVQNEAMGLGAETNFMDTVGVYLTEKGNKNIMIKRIEPGLEDCFMQLLK